MSSQSPRENIQERILYIISKNPSLSIEDISISCGIGFVETGDIVSQLQAEKID